MILEDHRVWKQRRLDSRNAHEEGFTEDTAKKKAELILEILGELGEIPVEIRDKIVNEKDEDRLIRIHKIAAWADSMSDFCHRYHNEFDKDHFTKK